MNTIRPRTLLAVPALLVSLVGLSACGADSSADTDDASRASTASASSSTTETGAASSTLALTADGSAAAKCAMPTVETLAGFDTAFAGTVTSLDEGTATLAVDQWYAGGDEADTVTVESPSKDLQDLLMAVDFQEGESYLVSATGGRVTLCGFTAQESPELQAIYDGAFAQ